jgi:uncharacterized protein
VKNSGQAYRCPHLPQGGGLKMMYIQVEQIESKGLDLRFEESAQDFPVLAEMIHQGECEFLAPIKISVRVVRIAGRVEVEGDVQTIVRLPCGRCLKSFATSLNSHFALTYTPRIEEVEIISEQDEVELLPEQINRIYFQGEQINLQDAVQEQIIMAFPIRALCGETCRGLCPQCGANLNDKDCGCSRRLSDSKFAALKNFRTRKT